MASSTSMTPSRSPTSRRRVVVGLSGGIDSTVAALLLREQGYEPVGLTLRLRTCALPSGERRSCCGPDAAGVAGAVARQLGIRHYVLDCHQEFDNKVLRPCWEDFKQGRTPNPCVLCNACVRFPKLAEFARDVGADAMATGHYANACATLLRRGADPRKDQSYFLHAIPSELYPMLRFPLGEFTKPRVREMAREFGLANAGRAESQDVCFAGPDGHFAEYLRGYFKESSPCGRILDASGKVLAAHDGIHRFTLGQRKGLGLGHCPALAGVPVRVTRIDTATGDVTVSGDMGDVMTRECVVRSFLWVRQPSPEMTVTGQIRYQHLPVECLLPPERECATGNFTVRFATPQKSVTPGQYLVLYAGDTVLGGGQIGI